MNSASFQNVFYGLLRNNKSRRMSKHSKHNTSQSIFTYGEKQKLKGAYGTKEERISQDSIKTFDMCTVCNNRVLEPVCCDKGHVFCRPCAITYLVRQKKKIAENNSLCEEEKRQRTEKEALEKVEEDAKKIVQFQKYDNYEELGSRGAFLANDKASQPTGIDPLAPKPTGMYEITDQKQKYVKSSFWTIENTPAVESKHEKLSSCVKCPGSDHKLTLKKLRTLVMKDAEGQFVCGICNKEIRRQRIGSYKCGHLICFNCRSDKCQMCGMEPGWLDLESSASAFASHNKAEVKTYTHAFYM